MMNLPGMPVKTYRVWWGGERIACSRLRSTAFLMIVLLNWERLKLEASTGVEYTIICSEVKQRRWW